MTDRISHLRSRKAQAVWVWTFALCPFLCSVAFNFAGAREASVASAPPRPALVFDQYLVPKGRIQAPVADARFGFTNRGPHPVHITKLEPSCGCVQPQMSPRKGVDDPSIVEPGESAEFWVQVRTPNEDPGLKEYTITVHYTDPEPRTEVVTFKFFLPEAKIFVQPAGLMFFMGNSKETVQDLYVHDYRANNLKVTGATCDSKHVKVEIVGIEEGEAGLPRWHLKVAVSGQLEKRVQHTELRIQTDDDQFPEILVPIMLEGLEGKIERATTGPADSQ